MAKRSRRAARSQKRVETTSTDLLLLGVAVVGLVISVYLVSHHLLTVLLAGFVLIVVGLLGRVFAKLAHFAQY